jgi:predicted ABC-class ATPase
MLNDEDLRKILRWIVRLGYKAYKDIEGAYDFGEFLLIIDPVQGNPFAS